MSTLGKKLPSRTADLTGRRFGALIALRRDGSTSSGNAAWACLCDCGQTTRSAGTDLRLGRTETCGCGATSATKRRHEASRPDLTGQRFERLTALSMVDMSNGEGRARWLVACDCGTQKIVRASRLLRGEVVSCGVCRAGDPRPGALRSVVTYGSAHQRVKRMRGSASAHPCVDCGKAARDWSYDRSDPAERRDDRGRPYSTDPTRYQARCRSCHKNFDLTATGASGESQEGETA